MKRIDTHQHLWNQDQFPYSWTKGIPALNRSFSLGDYREAAQGCEIEKTVFIECDVDAPHGLDEARHVQRLAEENPLIAGIVAAGRPEEDGFREHLEAISDLSKVRGLRRVFHTQPDTLPASSRLRENLRLLPSFDLTFDLCMLATQLPQGIALVEACPEVSFILDHCGVPDVKGRTFDPWREHIRQLAALPNVAACKISGLVAYADPENWTVEDLRPWFDHVIACFGWDRVVWGGDWPVCTVAASLRDWAQATDELTAGANDDERARFYHRNAERFYRV